MLKTKRVRYWCKDFYKIKKLIKSAFPRNEQSPFLLLMIRSGCRDVDFLAFYDASMFCGTAYLITYKNITFILYLAVKKHMRSKGYGSRILQYINDRYRGNIIILDIEAVNINADNYVQRIKRKDFYLRNGFFALHLGFEQNGTKYELLANEEYFPKKDLQQLFKHLQFGFEKIKVYTLK